MHDDASKRHRLPRTANQCMRISSEWAAGPMAAFALPYHVLPMSEIAQAPLALGRDLSPRAVALSQLLACTALSGQRSCDTYT